jgi:hypothetical protein
MEQGRVRSVVRRMVGAAKLDVAVFDEVRRDGSATWQAVVVITIVAAAQAIGAGGGGGPGIVEGLVPAFTGWILWSAVAYLIGVKMLGRAATVGELLRTLGFAQTPSLLAVLELVPGMAGLVGAVLGVWLLATGVVAIRHVLGVGTAAAVAIAVVAWVIAHLPMVLIHEILS